MQQKNWTWEWPFKPLVKNRETHQLPFAIRLTRRLGRQKEEQQLEGKGGTLECLIWHKRKLYKLILKFLSLVSFFLANILGGLLCMKAKRLGWRQKTPISVCSLAPLGSFAAFIKVVPKTNAANNACIVLATNSCLLVNLWPNI